MWTSTYCHSEAIRSACVTTHTIMWQLILGLNPMVHTGDTRSDACSRRHKTRSRAFCKWLVLLIKRHAPHPAPPSGLGNPKREMLRQMSGTAASKGCVRAWCSACKRDILSLQGKLLNVSGLWPSGPFAFPDRHAARLCNKSNHGMVPGQNFASCCRQRAISRSSCCASVLKGSWYFSLSTTPNPLPTGGDPWTFGD